MDCHPRWRHPRQTIHSGLFITEVGSESHQEAWGLLTISSIPHHHHAFFSTLFGVGQQVHSPLKAAYLRPPGQPSIWLDLECGRREWGGIHSSFWWQLSPLWFQLLSACPTMAPASARWFLSLGKAMSSFFPWSHHGNHVPLCWSLCYLMLLSVSSSYSTNLPCSKYSAWTLCSQLVSGNNTTSAHVSWWMSFSDELLALWGHMLTTLRCSHN